MRFQFESELFLSPWIPLVQLTGPSDTLRATLSRDKIVTDVGIIYQQLARPNEGYQVPVSSCTLPATDDSLRTRNLRSVQPCSSFLSLLPSWRAIAIAFSFPS